MRIIQLFIFVFCIQIGFAQKKCDEKFYQSYESFQKLEDSIETKINPVNTLIYKTCDGYRSFYLIKDSLYWTGYFIKSLLIDGFYPPSYIIAGKKYPPFLTELYVFNADSLYQLLVNANIYDVQQISEESIQTKLGYKTKKGNSITYNSLPELEHDCNGIIIIYGKENKGVMYRGALIESKDLHRIPTLKIFYETKQILIDATNSYYR